MIFGKWFEKYWIIKHHIFLNIELFTITIYTRYQNFHQKLSKWLFSLLSSNFIYSTKIEIGMVSTSFLQSLTYWHGHQNVHISAILRTKSALAAAFCRFSLSRVPSSCKCSSNGISLLMCRLINLFQPSIAFHKGASHLFCSVKRKTGLIYETQHWAKMGQIHFTVFGTYTQYKLTYTSITPFFHLFRSVVSSSFESTMSLSNNFSASLYFL